MTVCHSKALIYIPKRYIDEDSLFENPLSPTQDIPDLHICREYRRRSPELGQDICQDLLRVLHDVYLAIVPEVYPCEVWWQEQAAQ